MKQFEPIPVYPLNMRGRFGLTRHINRHGFSSAFFYTFFYALICVLLAALCLLPVGLRMFAGLDLAQLCSKAREFFSSLFQSYSQGPSTFFWSWNAPNDFVLEGSSMVLGVIGSLGLGFLALVFYFFYIKPRYLGVMYNEMGARIYGSSGSLSELSHRGGSCLRRYYTTYLAQIVGKIGASVAISVIARALGLLFAGFAVVAVLFSGLGAGLAGIALLLLSMFLGYMGETLLVLCYPVAIAEDKRYFSALGRGISLGWQNFWRVLSSLLLRDLYVYLWMLPGTILLSISVFSDALRLPLLLAALVYIAFTRLYFIPFRVAFNTVLYYDAVARELQARPAAAQTAPVAEETQTAENAPIVDETPVSQDDEPSAETAFDTAPAEDAANTDGSDNEADETKE